jgi:hypothetical protein
VFRAIVQSETVSVCEINHRLDILAGNRVECLLNELQKQESTDYFGAVATSDESCGYEMG